MDGEKPQEKASTWKEGQYLALRFAINARWFFVPIIFLVSITPKLSGDFGLLRPEAAVLLSALAVNAIFRVRLGGLMKTGASGGALWYFSAAQATYDLIVVFAFMLISGQVSTLAMFFLAPITVSMLTLGEAGVWTTALVAPIFLLTASLFTLTDFSAVLFGAKSFGELLSDEGAKDVLLGSALDSVFFLVLGWFSSLVAKFFRDREKDLEAKNHEVTIAYGRLSELDELKSQMVSVAAHQLRTPLSGIKWMLKMLSNGDLGVLNTDQDKVAKDGYMAVEHLVSLVNEMLEMDRIESGRVKFNFEHEDFNELVVNAVKEMSPKAVEKNITLCIGSDARPVDVFVDKERFGGAIENLIDNAIKYSPKGGSVDVGVVAFDDAVRLSVKDSGIGIPSSEQNRVFGRFYRASNAVRAETEGTGLGLSIVQSVVMRHSGKIWFESEEGKGSTFFIELPFKTVI